MTAPNESSEARERALLRGPYCDACRVPVGFPHVPSCRAEADEKHRSDGAS